MTRPILKWLAFAGVALLAQGGALAQGAANFPDKPVRIVLPYPPGGSTDTVARHLAEKLATQWQQPVIVDNKPGASGMIGTEYVARGPADGYTILFAITQHIQNPLIQESVRYHPTNDFAPVARILTVPAVLAVPASLPVNNVQEFIALVRSQPGKHSFGSFGPASTSHIYGESLNLKADLKAVHVPYKGAGPMLIDLLGGRLTFTVLDLGSLLPHVQAGKLKVLAAAGTKRPPQMPQVPTFKEAGLDGFEVISWMGFFLPAKTPEPVRRAWSDALRQHITSPAIATSFATIGLVPDYLGPDDFARSIERDTAAWKTLITLGKITAN